MMGLFKVIGAGLCTIALVGIAVGVAAGVLFAMRLGLTPRDTVASAIWHCRMILDAIVEALETMFR